MKPGTYRGTTEKDARCYLHWLTENHQRMGTYRPTTLKLASKHCPRAMNFYADGAETDRRIFGVGIAVHAVIQSWIQATNDCDRELDDVELTLVSLESCKRMIREGRKFEGAQEPPLPADDVWAGRDLAHAYVERHPILPSILLSSAELGMAVDENWKPTRYSPEARLRLIADYVTVTEEVGEDGDGGRVLVVRDYKSAWSTDETELDTVQMKAQAVLAWIHHGEDGEPQMLTEEDIRTAPYHVKPVIDCLRQEVVNLRTGATFKRDLWIHDDGLDILDRWTEELDVTMRALDDGREEILPTERLKEMMTMRRDDGSFLYQIGSRPGLPATFDGLEIPTGRYAVAPGGGCIGCPYVAHCQPGMEWREKALGEWSVEDRAAAWSVIVRELHVLKGVLKLKTDSLLLSRVRDFSDRVSAAAKDLAKPGEPSTGDRATAYAVLQASLKSLAAMLADETQEHPVAIPGGRVVGTVAVEERAATDYASELVAEAWTERGGEVAGLAKALGLGVAQLDAVAKVLYPDWQDKATRKLWVEALVEPKISRRFGIHRIHREDGS